MTFPVELVVATSNDHKLSEIAEILRLLGLSGVSINGLRELAPGVPEPDETGATFEENARLKALYYATRIGKACLSDDSGLCVDALGGRPGIFSSRYASSDEARIAKLIGELESVGAADADQRGAQFVCAACLATPDGATVESIGVCEGRIADSPAGSNGFGYDPVFYLPGLGCTMAQLTQPQKNRISHRGRAIAALVANSQLATDS